MTLTQISSRGVEDTLRWSLGASGTDHYTFTGPGLTGTVNDPTIYLTRGHTYIFENNNSANAHPFRIQSTSGSSGTVYNTGVTNNGGAGGTEIKITVAHDSPDILYYQCTSHPNMGGQFNVAGSVANESITTSKLAADSVTSAKIYPNAVDNAALGSNAVTSGNISADAVTDVKLSDHASDNSLRAVGTNHIKDDAVTTDKIADNSIVASQIQAAAVNESKLHISNSPTDGYFLSAQSGNAGGLTWAQVAQPDLTNLSASNLTSGTIPDARFPATLPAASGANLTNLAAANLTGTLPAISGANLTNLPGGGKVTRVFNTSAGTQYTNHVWTSYMSITVTNVTTGMRYLVFANYNQQAQNSSYPSYANLSTTHASPIGYNFYSVHSSSTAVNKSGFIFDTASSTNNRTFKIEHRSSSTDHNKKSILSSGAMVILELDVS